jgi:predicted RNase H-like HicB family nuclease
MPYDKVPKQLKNINDALAPVFEEMQTRFFFSTEAMIPNETEGYLIDYTLRHAAPTVSAIQTELIENFGDVIYGLATGEKIQPIMNYKYAAAVPLESEWADKHWLKVTVEPEVRRWFKFRMACSFDGNYYSTPGFQSLGSVVALGDTIEETIDLLKERAEMVKAHQIEVNLADLECITEQIDEGRELGVEF